MTVKELIEKLKAYPQGAIVYIRDSHYAPIDNVTPGHGANSVVFINVTGLEK